PTLPHPVSRWRRSVCSEHGRSSVSWSPPSCCAGWPDAPQETAWPRRVRRPCNRLFGSRYTAGHPTPFFPHSPTNLGTYTERMFGRVQRWLRRHEMLVDTISVTPFLLLCVGTILGYADADRLCHISVPLHLAFTFALLLPLALRRTFPAAVFTVVAAVAAQQLALGLVFIYADFAVFVAMYTVAAHCRWTWSLTALGVVEAGLALTIVQSPYSNWGDGYAFATYFFLILLFWVTGLYMKVRRGYFLGVE